MANKNNSSMSDNPVVVIIGLVASLLAIFTFITGINSLRGFRNQNGNGFPSPEPGSQAVLFTPTETPTPLPTNTSTSTPTLVKVYEEVAVDYPGMTVRMTDFNPSRKSDYSVVVRLRIIAGDTNKSKVERGLTYPIVNDIAGDWVEGTLTGIRNFHSGSNENDDGTLDVFLSAAYGENGYLGIQVNTCGLYRGFQDAILPISKDKVFEMTMQLALLEIGILDRFGNAKRGAIVEIIHAQSLSDSNLHQKCTPSNPEVKIADDSGIATISLVEGTYLVRIDYGFGKESDWFPIIDVAAGEYKRVIIQEE